MNRETKLQKIVNLEDGVLNFGVQFATRSLGVGITATIIGGFGTIDQPYNYKLMMAGMGVMGVGGASMFLTGLYLMGCDGYRFYCNPKK